MATNAVLAIIRASRPTFRNPYDKVAFCLHASFLAAGYSLIATGRKASESPSSSSGNEEVGIEGWNEMEDSYAFCYVRSENGETQNVLVNGLVLGDSLVFDVAPSDAKGSSEPLPLEINVNDFTNDYAGKNYAEHYKNFPSLIEKINSDIISKLEQPAKKKRSSNSPRSRTTFVEYHRGTESQPLSGKSAPLRDSSRLVYPPIPAVGGNDLFPGPGAGMYPGRRDGGMGGGMLLGPNDPGWGNIGIGGDMGPLGPGEVRGIPPGARFDPYGPPGVPGFEPNRFIRDQRRPPGRGTHPDLEHFSPF